MIKFQIESTVLASAMGFLNKQIKKTNALIASLENVHCIFHANKDNTVFVVDLRRTNLALDVIQQIKITNLVIDSPRPECILPAEWLQKVAKNASTPTLEINIDDVKVVITDGFDELQTGLMGKIDEFPILRKSKEIMKLEVPANVFKNAVENAAEFVAASTELREPLKTICIELKEGIDKLLVTGTDAMKLYHKEIPLGAKSPKSEQLLIRPEIAIAMSAINMEEDNVAISVLKDKRVKLIYRNYMVTGPIPAEKYVNYGIMLEMQMPCKVTVNKHTLSTMLRKIMDISEASFKAVALNIEDDQIIVDHYDQNTERSMKLKMECIKEGEMTGAQRICFNAKLLLISASAINAEKITMYMNDGQTLIYMKPFEKTDNGEVTLIMPISDLPKKEEKKEEEEGKEKKEKKTRKKKEKDDSNEAPPPPNFEPGEELEPAQEEVPEDE